MLNITGDRYIFIYNNKKYLIIMANLHKNFTGGYGIYHGNVIQTRIAIFNYILFIILFTIGMILLALYQCYHTPLRLR